jgi:hypothetical protein
VSVVLDIVSVNVPQNVRIMDVITNMQITNIQMTASVV